MKPNRRNRRPQTFKQLVGRVTWPTRYKVRQQKEDRLTKAWAQKADGNTPPPLIMRLHAPLSSFIITAKQNDHFDETDILDYLDDDGELMKVQDGKYTVTYVPVD